MAQVVLDVPVLFRAGDEITGEFNGDRGVEPFRVDLGDGVLDEGQQRGVPVEVPGGDGGANHDHDERPARLEIITVDARRLALGLGFLVFLQLLLDPLPRDLRRLILVVQSQIETGRFGDLVFIPVDQGVAQLLDILQGSVQVPVLPEKGVGFAGAGVDRSHLARAEGLDFFRQLVDKTLQRLLFAAVDHDVERRRRRQALVDLVRDDDALLALGQEFPEGRLQLELRGPVGGDPTVARAMREEVQGPRRLPGEQRTPQTGEPRRGSPGQASIFRITHRRILW